MEEYKREYCCSNCGLIWFDGYRTPGIVECPECQSSNKNDGGIYACDTMGYFYSSKAIEMGLKERGKVIHYAQGHPYFSK